MHSQVSSYINAPLSPQQLLTLINSDLSQIASDENKAKYCAILMTAYNSTFQNLGLSMSPDFRDPNSFVFNSAITLGSVIGDPCLPQHTISQLLLQLSRDNNQSYPSMLGELYNHLRARFNSWPPLGSVSSHGALPPHGGSLSSNGAGYQSGPFLGSDNTGHSISNSLALQGVFSDDLRSENSPVVPSSGRSDVGAVPESTQLTEIDQSLPVASSSPVQNQSSANFPLTVFVCPRGNNRELVGPDKIITSIELSKNILKPYFGMSLVKAANRIGISPTTLKSVCRKLGIQRWPYKGSNKKKASSSSSEEAGAALRTSGTPSSFSGEAGPASHEEYPHTESNQNCVIYVEGEPLGLSNGVIGFDMDQDARYYLTQFSTIPEEPPTQQPAQGLNPLPPGRNFIGPRRR